ncbi:TcaA NTF2-like domain-containing protein [Brevibacillus dissolubilis]|uniref:TcaA NTF2-like domain-containing protein n=1 Tax=Brevibacillus dissolubilis TaxID=1844116 RepID=UPI001115F3CE|nr:hypothetical protein [Brevibacillus dissolubilis]
MRKQGLALCLIASLLLTMTACAKTTDTAKPSHDPNQPHVTQPDAGTGSGATTPPATGEGTPSDNPTAPNNATNPTSPTPAEGNTPSSPVDNPDQLIRQTVTNYEKALVNAINQGDFSLVEPLLVPDSSLYKSQQNLVQTLSQKGTIEKLIGLTIQRIEKAKSPSTYRVYVTEIISIQKANAQPQSKEFAWIYTVKMANGRAALSEIAVWETNQPTTPNKEQQSQAYTLDHAIQTVADLYYRGSTQDLRGYEVAKETYVVQLGVDAGSGLISTVEAFLVEKGKVIDRLVKEDGSVNESFWQRVEQMKTNKK